MACCMHAMWICPVYKNRICGGKKKKKEMEEGRFDKLIFLNYGILTVGVRQAKS